MLQRATFYTGRPSATMRIDPRHSEGSSSPPDAEWRHLPPDHQRGPCANTPGYFRSARAPRPNTHRPSYPTPYFAKPVFPAVLMGRYSFILSGQSPRGLSDKGALEEVICGRGSRQWRGSGPKVGKRGVKGCL